MTRQNHAQPAFAAAATAAAATAPLCAVAPRQAQAANADLSDGATLCFGQFELDPTERSLRIHGKPAALGGRAFDLLLALAQRCERLVTKQELLDIVWPGLVVEEHNIATQIGTLRKLLGAQAIATVTGRGYRLAVRRVDAADGAVGALPALCCSCCRRWHGRA